MQSRKLMFALGSGLLLTAAGAVNADTATSNTDLQAQVAALQAKVQQLEGKQSDTWLDQRRADEVKALVKEVLADADTRASLLESGATAGHNGKNFFITSEDGNFLLKIYGQVQVRYVYNNRDDHDEATAGDEFDAHEGGFSIRRAKLGFKGHIVSPQWFYDVRVAVSESSNDARLEKAVVGYEAMDGLKLWAGEDKAPFLREELISSSSQLGVERSIVNEFFTAGYTQGVGAEWTSDMFRVSGMINDGVRAGEKGGAETFANQEFPVLDENGDPVDADGDGIDDVFLGERPVDKLFDGDGSDFALSGRVDVKILGDWDSWNDFESWSGQDTSLFVGGGFHWEKGETGDDFLNNDFIMWTVDASFKTGGFGVYGAVVGLHTMNDDAAQTDDIDVFGFVVQASYLFDDKIEPFVRYDWLDLGDLTVDGADQSDDFNALTFGANYYFAKHSAKIQVDVVWAFDPVDPSLLSQVNLSSLGLAADTGDNDDQIALRAQFQLLF